MIHGPWKWHPVCRVTYARLMATGKRVVIRTEAVMNIKKCIRLSLMCCFVVLNGVLVQSVAWGGCTVQERIELGKQGYAKEDVEKTCADTGENFLETLSKSMMTDLANGLTNSLTKGLNNALGGRERNSTASAPSSDAAHLCVTNVGACPLSGIPTGAPCYCQAWNGATFMGVSK